MKLSPSVSIKQTQTGLEYIEVDSPLCDAKIFLQGAQLTQFTPKEQKPLIWVSQDEDYIAGKSAAKAARTGSWRKKTVDKRKKHYNENSSTTTRRLNL